MPSEYIQAALRHARYEILAGDGGYYVDVPERSGIYAHPGTLEQCREKLRKVLEEWVLFRVHKNLRLPAIDGAELLIRELA